MHGGKKTKKLRQFKDLHYDGEKTSIVASVLTAVD